MMYPVHRLALPCIAAIALLSGCAGSNQPPQAVYTIPTPQATPYDPPVSQSYIIQRAPDTPVARSPGYEGTDLFEVGTAAGREAAQPSGRSAVTRRIGANPARYQSGFAPFESDGEERTASATITDEGMDARERAAERAAERRAKRQDVRTARANPKVDRRGFLGRFVTRPGDETRPEAATRAVRRRQPAPAAPQPRSTPRPQGFAERSVARAPIPGLKPYILARTPSPSSKPRRAAPAVAQPQSREFQIASAATLPNALPAATPPSGVTIPTEPGADLSARFFPTPGKPSTLGTDQDQPLDVAAIDAARYGIGESVGTVVDSDAATAEWTDAVRLIESGEVEALAILEDADLVLTLCSGRDILTTPPDLAAAATLTAPQIICGQNKPLALR